MRKTHTQPWVDGFVLQCNNCNHSNNFNFNCLFQLQFVIVIEIDSKHVMQVQKKGLVIADHHYIIDCLPISHHASGVGVKIWVFFFFNWLYLRVHDIGSKLRGTQIWVRYGCPVQSFDHHPITKLLKRHNLLYKVFQRAHF